MQTCRNELTYSATELADVDQHFVVAQKNHLLVGFYALERSSCERFELTALFVDPTAMRSGIGRRLLDDALQTMQQQQGKQLIIQSDPHAASFYLSMGAQRVGERESGSIEGRFLPVFCIEPVK